jgi:ubiquinone/menaquinone biosynthesis C-methylase UbiE
MESQDEGQRLLRQADAHPSRERLLRAGVKPGLRVLDAGCGAGAVTRELCELVGPTGQVTALEPGARLLSQARATLAAFDTVTFVQAGLPSTGLPEATFDLVWCHLVLEHLRDPEAAVRELVRVVKPGGRVVVCDVDGNGLLNWPQPALVDDGVARVLAALEAAGVDLYVGRKLHHLLWRAGLTQLRDWVDPAFAFSVADERWLDDWRTRFEALRGLAEPRFPSPAAWEGFVHAFLLMLKDPGVLKYGVLLTAEGTRA